MAGPDSRTTARGGIGAAGFVVAGALVAAESRWAAAWISTAVVVTVALAALAMPIVRPPRAALEWIAGLGAAAAPCMIAIARVRVGPHRVHPPPIPGELVLLLLPLAAPALAVVATALASRLASTRLPPARWISVAACSAIALAAASLRVDASAELPAAWDDDRAITLSSECVDRMGEVGDGMFVTCTRHESDQRWWPGLADGFTEGRPSFHGRPPHTTQFFQGGPSSALRLPGYVLVAEGIGATRRRPSALSTSTGEDTLELSATDFVRVPRVPVGRALLWPVGAIVLALAAVLSLRALRRLGALSRAVVARRVPDGDHFALDRDGAPIELDRVPSGDLVAVLVEPAPEGYRTATVARARLLGIGDPVVLSEDARVRALGLALAIAVNAVLCFGPLLVARVAGWAIAL